MATVFRPGEVRYKKMFTNEAMAWNTAFACNMQASP